MPVLRPVRSALPAAARLAAILRRMAGGGLAGLPVDVELWDGSVLPAGAPGGSAGRLRVSRRALAYLLDEPNQLGLSRAYVAGELGFDGDLSALLAERARFASVRPSARDLALATATAVLTAGPDVLRRPPVPESEARPRGRRHSRARDRAAVRHHYDVSNDFYRRLLGPSLVYSCAYFESPDDTLEAAQVNKLRAICDKLALGPDDHVLEIGSGWGGFALFAATYYGCRVTTTTISAQQHDHVADGMEYQPRNMNGRQDAAHVDFEIHPRHRERRSGTGCHPQEPRPPVADPFVRGQAWSEAIESDGPTPGVAERVEKLLLLCLGASPRVIRSDLPPREAADRDQCRGSRRICRSEQHAHHTALGITAKGGALGADGREIQTPEGIRNNAKSIFRIRMLASGFAGRPK